MITAKDSAPKYLRDGRAPVPAKEITSKIMSLIRGKNTKPELELRKALWSAGLRGYRLHSKELAGRPDISFSRTKLALFVNGCFWHSCPYCKFSLPKTHSDFWKTKFKKNKERDANKIDHLRKQGWKVLVFWECQIKENPIKCVQIVKHSHIKRMLALKHDP